jgi:hypothetical protein
MKKTTRSNIYLPMAALILTAAIAIPAAAQHQVPFKGTMQADEIHTHTSPTTAVITGSGTGIATHVGKFSLTYVLTASAGLNDTGSATLVAANGDSIYLTIAGSAALTAPGVISVLETWTVTGGTGRFTGAQGSFIAERLDFFLEVPIFSSGTFLGTITSPGAAH